MKKLTILLLTSLTILFLAAAAIFYRQTEKPAIPQEQPTRTLSGDISPTALSEEELTKFWANSTRCPKEGFAVSSDENDIIQEGSVRFFVNSVNINFTTDAICEDAERIAQLLDAKIVGFEPTTNLYSFQIPTRTKEELDAAIAKIKALNDPEVEGVFGDVPIRAIPFPRF